GVEKMQEAHEDVDIYIAALDEKLNEKAYITPGLYRDPKTFKSSRIFC
ncbi:hypothetical protein BUE67_13965, partial [Corynebacterium diphtheriae]